MTVEVWLVVRSPRWLYVGHLGQKCAGHGAHSTSHASSCGTFCGCATSMHAMGVVGFECWGPVCSRIWPVACVLHFWASRGTAVTVPYIAPWRISFEEKQNVLEKAEINAQCKGRVGDVLSALFSCNLTIIQSVASPALEIQRCHLF